MVTSGSIVLFSSCRGSVSKKKSVLVTDSVPWTETPAAIRRHGVDTTTGSERQISDRFNKSEHNAYPNSDEATHYSSYTYNNYF